MRNTNLKITKQMETFGNTQEQEEKMAVQKHHEIKQIRFWFIPTAPVGQPRFSCKTERHFPGDEGHLLALCQAPLQQQLQANSTCR